jgi:hypothetical protein
MVLGKLLDRIDLTAAFILFMIMAVDSKAKITENS